MIADIAELVVVAVVAAICETVNPPYYPLVYDDDYEICGQFPYPIRRKGNTKHIAESVNNKNTYYCLRIGKHYKTKHNILGVQWLGLDKDDKTHVIDHISRNHLDNHIDNLRVLTHKENANNKTKHPKVQHLPTDAKVLHDYPNTYYSKSQQACYYNKQYYPLLYDPQGDRMYVVIPYKQDKQNPHRIIFF